ncbi:MAG: ADP-forming succinate--CoA ligase subunit beta [Vicinamibacteria bacterium]|nr:ADP-forming succinate--CoA ligase subunit beta [Vicinamibacteria bacterium]
MKIHEYQGKAVLRKFGVKVPDGEPAFTPEEAVSIGNRLGYPCVVKAQIHAGGRGKGGGVKLAKDRDECKDLAEKMLGMTLVTHQTGPEGRVVKRVLIEQGMNLEGAREMYLAVVMDRESQRPVVMASSAGGVDIEETAAKNPKAILKQYVDPAVGFQAFQARQIAFGLGLPNTVVGQAVQFIRALYEAFEKTDSSLLEINPWMLTADGVLYALDAKINFDDNALDRHPDLRAYRDLDEEEPLEVEASKHSLNYIKLPGGNVGCMVNGAGLAMATMDIIKLAGGMPANFLDVGGGANADQIRNAFRILMADKDVKAVFINIFGGILRCDVLAEGVIAAVRDLGVKVPIVVRMKGNKEELGKQMLLNSGLAFQTADNMMVAAKKVVATVSGAPASAKAKPASKARASAKGGRK